MQAPFTYRAEYPTEGTVPIRDIAASLVAHEKLLLELGPLLEGIAPGLLVDAIKVELRSVSHESPLRDVLVISIWATFQKDLEREVPPFVASMLNVDTAGYETLLTILVLVIAIYGIDFVMKRINGALGKSKVQQMLDGLIQDAAKASNRSPEDIRALLEKKYSKSRLREIGRSAIKAIAPAKTESGVPVRLNNLVVPAEVVAEIPSNDDLVEAEAEEIFEHKDDIEIELHAQDKDRNKQGWAGVLRGISGTRLKMQLYPDIDPKEIYNKDVIRGDVLLVYRMKEDGSYQPHMFHLKSVRGLSDEGRRIS